MVRYILSGLFVLFVFLNTVFGQSISVIDHIELKKIEQGTRFQITLPDPALTCHLSKQDEQLVITIPHAAIAAEWLKKMEVRSFAWPVTQLSGDNQPDQAQFILTIDGHYRWHRSRQGHQVSWVIAPINIKDLKAIQARYHGKPISLNFQNISLRAVLQILAKFAGVNLVVSDAVTGNITLNLNKVPWDQALDIILTSKSLGKREAGKVIYVAPLADIAIQERAALVVQQQDAALLPLDSAFISVKYANANDLLALLQSQNNSFLGARGKVSVDKRTNTLLIQDTPQQMQQIKQLLQHLDVPVTQVLIEARLVVMDQRAKQELGVTLKNLKLGHTGLSNMDGAYDMSIGTLPTGFALDLELQAQESEGQSKVISSPHLTVANNQQAMIEQGQDIPYQTSTSSGATQVEYRKAVLGLSVSPQITPDGKVLMHLDISDDHVSNDKSTVSNTPLVDTSRISTQVLVDNNQTIVLGGIVKETHDKSERRVPFLSKIPLLGFLFRNSVTEDNRTELVIFVTPRIIEQKPVEHSAGLITQKSSRL